MDIDSDTSSIDFVLVTPEHSDIESDEDINDEFFHLSLEDISVYSQQPVVSAQSTNAPPSEAYVAPSPFSTLYPTTMEVPSNPVYFEPTPMDVQPTPIAEFISHIQPSTQNPPSILFGPPEQAQELLRLRAFKIYDEYSPLFMVLPTTLSVLSDPIGKADGIHARFQLMLLCECGDHTRKSTSNMPHVVHLHEHQPYDIQQSEYLFAEYGRYILATMRLIRAGYSAGGLTVPSVESRQLIDGIMDLSLHFKFDSDNFEALVDGMISYLSSYAATPMAQVATLDQTLSPQPGSSWPSLQCPPRPTWRQLQQFLQVSTKFDKDLLQPPPPPRNISRIVVGQESLVKWICMEHAYDYQDHSRDTSAATDYLSLLDIPRRNYSEEMGYLNCRLPTRTAADLVMDIVNEAKMLELRIKPEWDVTKEDLAAIQQKMLQSKVISLAFDGSYLSKLRWEHGFNGRSYDPILQMLADGRIQSFTFLNCLDFFKDTTSRLGRGRWVSFGLEALHLTWTEEEEWGLEEFMDNLVIFVDQYPRLEQLAFTIHSNNFSKMMPLIQTLAKHLEPTRTQATVTLVGLLERRLQCTLCDGRIHNIEATLQYSHLPVSKAPIVGGGVQRLNLLMAKEDMASETGDNYISYFLEFMQTSTGLKYLAIKDENEDRTVFRVIPALNRALSNHNCPVQVHYNRGGAAEVVFTLKEKEPLKVHHDESPQDDSPQLPSATNVHIWRVTNYDMRANSCASDLQFLHSAIATHPHQLKSFVLMTSKLELAAIPMLQQVIDQSALADLTIWALCPAQRKEFIFEIPAHSLRLLTSLTLHGENVQAWICRLRSTVTSRVQLPLLAKLHVHLGKTTPGGDLNITLTDVAFEWLRAMVICPHTLSPYNDSLKQLIINCATLSCDNWTTLLRTVNYTHGGLELLNVQETNFDEAQVSKITGHWEDAYQPALDTVYCHGTYALRGRNNATQVVESAHFGNKLLSFTTRRQLNF
ncbi:hypothetical protein BGZ93_002052 [Podila epicladia]|nr:hypothetical protein BGZ92_004802 [Podila epicladia]KAG0097750.1 hypothetical protein BGZ93_002052 [Podila epicladia]